MLAYYIKKMKLKILLLILLISSFWGFLEWGPDKRFFLFEIEYQIISEIFMKKSIIFHPFIIIPFLGQILLVINIFQKYPDKKLTYIGIISLGLLIGFIALIGIISFRYNILISTIPFLITAFLTIKKISLDKEI